MVDILEKMHDLPPRDWHSSADLEERDKKVAQMLPLYWVSDREDAWGDGNEPSFLLIHGLKDKCVIASESETFATELQAAGAEAELLLLPDAGFVSLMDQASAQEILEAMEGFLNELFGMSEQ
jgi:hypothetical protein